MGDHSVHMSSTDNSVPLTSWTTSLSSSSLSNISTATTAMVENVVTAVASGEVTADNAETLRVVRYVVQKVCVPVVVAVGVLGNSLNMVVLTRRCMKNSTSCYLTALAAFDMVYLLCSLTLSFKHYHLVHRNVVYVHWFRYGRVLSDMAANVSVLLTITFTVERYIGVCHPIKGRVLCTPQRARIVIALVVAVAVICTLPELFETEVVWKTNDRNWNTTTTNITTTTTTTNTSHPDLTTHSSCLRYPTTRYTLFASTYGYQIGYYWFLAVGFTFVPLLVLCVFNGILIASLFRAAQLRIQLTSRGSGRGSHLRGSCRGSSRGSSRGPSRGPSRGLHLSSSRGHHPRGHSKGHSRRPHSSSSFSSSSSPSSCCHSSSPSPVPERGCREQQWITQMLVTVVVVFILCQLPGAILMLIRASRHLAQVEMSAYSRNQFYMAANVTNLLLQINAAINFLLYSVTSSKFRQVCVRVLCLRSGVRPLPPLLRSSLYQQELRLTSLESRSSRKPPASSRDRWKSVSSRGRTLQHVPCYSLLGCSSSARQQSGGVNGTAHAPSQNFRGKDGVCVSGGDFYP